MMFTHRKLYKGWGKENITFVKSAQRTLLFLQQYDGVRAIDLKTLLHNLLSLSQHIYFKIFEAVKLFCKACFFYFNDGYFRDDQDKFMSIRKICYIDKVTGPHENLSYKNCTSDLREFVICPILL